MTRSTTTQAGASVPLATPAARHRPQWTVLAAISTGGTLGALGRYGIGLALPTRATAFPWATLLINATGCLLIGALMVLVSDVWAGRRLVRPFFGVGVLGGYTTFSTYVVDIQRLVDRGAPGTALAYLGGTLLAALLAVYAGATLTRLATRRRRRHRGGNR
ncbi:MAG TPA: CrcB family protein [Rugosimonospora sp.]|nr:CrcB family protein [Rugosimonospora sp.]